MESTTAIISRIDLYSLLKVDRSSSADEIHKAYKSLSTTFHPDKLPPSTSSDDRERIQQVFLEFKRANDILTDPVLRLTYNHYGEDGVSLVRRIQQQRREQQTRREATFESRQEEEEDEDEEEEYEATLYDRVERLLQSNPLQARQELQRFMEQHDYHEDLTEENQVQLACSMDFPPVIDLKALFFDGRDYLQYVKQRTRSQFPGLSAEERKYMQHGLKREQGLVDYQINRIKDSQKASVGFSLSSLQPNAVSTISGTKIQPKWSMAMGASTDVVFPEVAKLALLVGKEEKEQKHPASTFVNMVYQPVPNSQINMTANLSNDQSHQLVLGSARTFSNRSSHRYSLTFLSKSPLETNMILNFKSFRHIKDVGMASGGLSMGANGKFLQWNAKWEAARGTDTVHKCSAKVSVGMMQGNSLQLGYKMKNHKKSWLDEHIVLPKSLDLSAEIGRFPKLEAMVTQEITSLATHPSLGFGMEHDITLGCWTWIWELHYNHSTFRIPIPVLHLGTISSPSTFYTQKLYYGFYYLMLQSLAADILQQDDGKKDVDESEKEETKVMTEISRKKTRHDAQQQVRLMEGASERKRYTEFQQDGLVILQATYWLEHQNCDEIQLATHDVTIQLQFWVSKGKLRLPSAPKSSLLGFYDLETDLKVRRRTSRWNWRVWRRWTHRKVTPEPQQSIPKLRVRYSYHGFVYEITISERMELVLPSTHARLLGHASVVQ